jgi:carbon-monoxide dehydrogenase small subunit
MAALDLLEHNAAPSDDEIRAAVHGNLCRCTGYQSIVTSIRDAAARMRGEPGTDWYGDPLAEA